jgi:cell division protein FtsX
VATVIRHVLSEGALLARERLGVTLILGLLLAVPLATAAVTAACVVWLHEVVTATPDRVAVPVLLRPELDATARSAWLSRQRDARPDWEIRSVPPDELVSRLRSWLPTLAPVLEDDRGLLPPLVEVVTDTPSLVAGLESDPMVLAVGPVDPIAHRLDRASRRLAVALGIVCGGLLLAAAVLAAVWVHLELYRHADELEIMRLVGATETAVRGPFVVAVSTPGVVAAVLAPVVASVTLDGLDHVTSALGLQPIEMHPGLVVLQVVIALALPVGAAWITLARHATVGTTDA